MLTNNLSHTFRYYTEFILINTVLFRLNFIAQAFASILFWASQTIFVYNRLNGLVFHFHQRFYIGKITGPAFWTGKFLSKTEGFVFFMKLLYQLVFGLWKFNLKIENNLLLNKYHDIYLLGTVFRTKSVADVPCLALIPFSICVPRFAVFLRLFAVEVWNQNLDLFWYHIR